MNISLYDVYMYMHSDSTNYDYYYYYCYYYYDSIIMFIVMIIFIVMITMFSNDDNCYLLLYNGETMWIRWEYTEPIICTFVFPNMGPKNANLPVDLGAVSNW